MATPHSIQDISTDNVSVIGTVDQIEALRDFWKAHGRHPNVDVDYYRMLLASNSNVVRPYIIVVGPIGRPRAILIGRIEQTRMPIKIGYTTIWSPRVKTLFLAYGGLLGEESHQTCKYFISQLRATMVHREVDLVCFNQLNVESDLYQLLADETHTRGRSLVLTHNTHRSLSLASPYDSFLRRLSKKTRDNFKRYAKRLSHHFGDQLVTKCYRDADDFDRIFLDSESVAQKTYLRGIGAGFRDDEITRRLYTVALDRGWLYAYIMYIRSEPVAFCHVLKYGNTAFANGRGFDSAFRSYSVGNLLQLKVTEDFCADPDVQEFDFGFGDAEYKRLLCDKEWEEASVHLFPATWHGAILHKANRLAMYLTRLATAILHKLSFFAKTKRYLRNRLASKTRS